MEEQKRQKGSLFAVIFLLALFTFSLGYLTGARTFTACEIKIDQK